MGALKEYIDGKIADARTALADKVKS